MYWAVLAIIVYFTVVLLFIAAMVVYYAFNPDRAINSPNFHFKFRQKIISFFERLLAKLGTLMIVLVAINVIFAVVLIIWLLVKNL